MEMQFRKNPVSCLKPVLSEVQNLELTQEVRLPEGMGGADRILGVWGQCVLRSKEWRSDSLRVSGGLMVWVLYDPEEGEMPQSLESWIPFQAAWDLPEGCPEGRARVTSLPRFLDARSISAGKLMLRCGVGILAEAWSPWSAEVYQPQQEQPLVELLRSDWPVRLPREAGEKTFHQEEELTLPPSAPQPEKLVYYRAEPMAGDRKVMGSKLVFRGGTNLHMLYLSEEGQLHSWDVEVPFSQFADLDRSHSADAQADIWVSPTAVEVQLDAEGKLRYSGDMTAQYLVDDRDLLELTEDAYSPGRELEVRRQTLELPVLLDSRRENLYGEQTIQGEADLMADVSLLPDFPRIMRNADEVLLEQPAMVQALWYGADGKLHSQQQRLQEQHTLQASPQTRITAVPMAGPQPGVTLGSGSFSIRGEIPVQLQSSAGQGLPMITGITLGEVRTPDPGRPSLILRRTEGGRLWDLAKESGSTVEAIRSANGLTGESEPGKLLLIPVL